MSSQSVNTQHGTVHFYEGNDAGARIMNSMVRISEMRAEKQASQAKTAMSTLETQDFGISAAVIGTIAGVVGATAGVVSAAAGATSAATGLASLVSQSEATGLSTLEVTVLNETLTPVVLSKYSTSYCSSGKMPGPLLTGQSDSAIVFFGEQEKESGPYVQFHFLTGGGRTKDNSPLTPLPCVIELKYESSNWIAKFSLDGSGFFKMQDKENTACASFTTPSESALDFTVAVTGLEKSAAEMAIYFLPSSV